VLYPLQNCHHTYYAIAQQEILMEWKLIGKFISTDVSKLMFGNYKITKAIESAIQELKDYLPPFLSY